MKDKYRIKEYLDKFTIQKEIIITETIESPWYKKTKYKDGFEWRNLDTKGNPIVYIYLFGWVGKEEQYCSLQEAKNKLALIKKGIMYH